MTRLKQRETANINIITWRNLTFYVTLIGFVIIESTKKQRHWLPRLPQHKSPQRQGKTKVNWNNATLEAGTNLTSGSSTAGLIDVTT